MEHKNENITSPFYNNVIISDLAKDILDNLRLIGATVILFLIISIIYLHVAEYKYTAEIKIVPVQSSGNSGGMGKQVAGLAALAGVDLPNDQRSTAFQLYLEILDSREIADKLSARQDLMEVIFKRYWDSKTGSWHKPDSIKSKISKMVKEALGIPVYNWQPPNGADLQEYIKENVKIVQQPKKMAIAVTYNHTDPVFAVHFLTDLHQTIDDTLRQRALNQANNYINYLTTKLSTVTVAELRNAIANILTDQEKMEMIASSNTPYAADSLGGIAASRRPTTPNPMLILIGGLVAGIVVGISGASLRRYVPKLRKR